MRAWLDEESVTSEAEERLARGVAEWERSGRRADTLWSAKQLRGAETAGALAVGTGAARAFVEASRAAVQRARRRWWGLRLGAPLAIAIAAAEGATWAVRLRRRTAAQSPKPPRRGARR